MPDRVHIGYRLKDGTSVRVHLHQVGHEESWVLDLHMNDGFGWEKAHQHSIVGEPEVTVGD